MSEKRQQRALVSLTLVGKVWGELRRLSAFDKKRHTVPDKVTPVTQGFLERLCEEELTEDAEELFQAARQQFGYKRKEISLDVGAGYGRLECKDFLLELRYELDEEDPSRYSLETSVTPLASRDLLESEAFAAAVGSRFDRLRCGLSGKVSVESVIDAVEEEESGDLSVDYPSDCRHCTVAIDGVAAEIFLDGAILEVRFGKLVTAGSLLAAFESVSERFAAAEGLADLLVKV
ncbi:hypothetical protein [Pelagicoccus sp. SDUM812003]|uniref:hypothetical protein n=1 Tax=Pelagicoccus sp. SDUM812003 TaxID=3041267 RepID=UPI00280FF2F2|nr:hypothetical protein [Pelagicoccus sp. SDUM812003]MDQ8202421.1 hypothetical protein [Pelagicoccus sp. SDUM812003]